MAQVGLKIAARERSVGVAQALTYAACRRGVYALFIPTAKMLAHLAGGRAGGTHEQCLAGYTRPDLLTLDEFGFKALPTRPRGPL
jgi:DNA replication protein DnaC